MDKPKMDGWTDAQKAAWQKAADELAAAEKEASAPPSPEEQIEAMVAESARLAREAADERAYKLAVKEHGETRTGRLRTREGSIIFRAMTGLEFDSMSVRLEELKASMDQLTAAREAFLDVVLHPSRAETKQKFDRFPMLWDYAFRARDVLSAGVEVEARKNG
jgi:hypothetical protein